MTQRVFDIENEKDMADLWDILQDRVIKIERPFMNGNLYPEYVLARTEKGEWELPISINWHNHQEITRPIQEATEQDIGKLCCFWSVETKEDVFGKLRKIDNNDTNYKYRMSGGEGLWFEHCRRLTKQEIEELC